MILLKKFFSFLIFMSMLGMVASVAWQVFTRYILHDPTIWTEEATRVFLIYMTFMGAGLSMLRGDEVKVTFITSRLPVRFQWALSLVTHLLSMVFLAVLLWYTFPLMKRLAHQPLPALRFSKSYVYVSLILGSLSMFLALGERVFNSIKQPITRRKNMEGS